MGNVQAYIQAAQGSKTFGELLALCNQVLAENGSSPEVVSAMSRLKTTIAKASDAQGTGSTPVWDGVDYRELTVSHLKSAFHTGSTTNESALTQSWNAVWTQVDQSFKDLWDQAQKLYVDEVKKSADKYRPDSEQYLAYLRDTRQDLGYLGSHLSEVAQADRGSFQQALTDLQRRYDSLMAGVMQDAAPAPTTPTTGLAPLLIVLGLAVGASAIAWMVTSLAYAKNMHEETALKKAELDARLELARQGRTLPASTLPPGEKPKSPAADIENLMTLGLEVAAGLAAVGLAYKFLPRLLEGRRTT